MIRRIREEGFTLLETLVAVSIVTIAIVAPMSLASQSLTASYYARDQLIASQLAQEAIEVVRHIRDGNILALNSTDPTRDVFSTSVTPSMYVNQGTFVVDTRDDSTWLISGFGDCAVNPTPADAANRAPAMRTDAVTQPDGTHSWTSGTFYAYGHIGSVSDPCVDQSSSGWYPTPFTRTVRVDSVANCPDAPYTSSICEVRVTSIVSWKEPNFPAQQVEIQDNLYRWPNGS